MYALNSDGDTGKVTEQQFLNAMVGLKHPTFQKDRMEREMFRIIKTREEEATDNGEDKALTVGDFKRVVENLGLENEFDGQWGGEKSMKQLHNMIREYDQQDPAHPELLNKMEFREFRDFMSI